VAKPRNTVNLMTGSGMQQARSQSNNRACAAYRAALLASSGLGRCDVTRERALARDREAGSAEQARRKQAKVGVAKTVELVENQENGPGPENWKAQAEGRFPRKSTGSGGTIGNGGGEHPASLR
jgi:hypothetical protein